MIPDNPKSDNLIVGTDRTVNIQLVSGTRRADADVALRQPAVGAVSGDDPLRGGEIIDSAVRGIIESYYA